MQARDSLRIVWNWNPTSENKINKSGYEGNVFEQITHLPSCRNLEMAGF